MKITILYFLFSLFISASYINAQLSSLKQNDVIRVTVPAYFYYPIVGKFVKLSSDSLFLKVNSTYSFPIQQINKIEFPISKNNTFVGAIIGAGAVGLTMGLANYNANRNSSRYSRVEQSGFFSGFLTGALVGGGIGAAVGSQIYSDSWNVIALD